MRLLPSAIFSVLCALSGSARADVEIPLPRRPKSARWTMELAEIRDFRSAANHVVARLTKRDRAGRTIAEVVVIRGALVHDDGLDRFDPESGSDAWILPPKKLLRMELPRESLRHFGMILGCVERDDFEEGAVDRPLGRTRYCRGTLAGPGVAWSAGAEVTLDAKTPGTWKRAVTVLYRIDASRSRKKTRAEVESILKSVRRRKMI